MTTVRPTLSSAAGGFAGNAAVRRLVGEPRVRVTLLDKFQPLLYQVAAAELTAEDVCCDLARMFCRHERWAARNILAELEGGVGQAVHYHELHGRLAFAAWLGGHAELAPVLGDERYLPPHHRSAELLDPGQVDTPQIDWRAP